MFSEFPGGSDGKESACNSGDLGSIPGLEDPLGKGMATHSSIIAWRIPWTEEPGVLQNMGSGRVKYNLFSNPEFATHYSCGLNKFLKAFESVSSGIKKEMVV